MLLGLYAVIMEAVVVRYFLNRLSIAGLLIPTLIEKSGFSLMWYEALLYASTKLWPIVVLLLIFLFQEWTRQW